MTCKLNQEVRKIISPIILKVSGSDEVKRFTDGTELAEADFEKNYLIDSVAAGDGAVVITIRENDMVNAINWIGEEAVAPSFF